MVERKESASRTASPGAGARAAAKSLRGAGSEALNEAAAPAKARVRGGADTAERAAVNFADQIRETVASLLDEQKMRMADMVHGFADALRHAADSLERDDKALAARYADQAAERVAGLAASVRQKNLGEMLAEAEDLARRQPELFLTGAVAAGFVAGRLLAGPPARREHASSPASGDAPTSHPPGGYAAGTEPMAGYGPGPAEERH